MKDSEEEIAENYGILNIVNAIKLLIEEDRYNNDSFKDLEKDFPEEIIKLEEALLNYMGENDLKILKQEFLNKWKLAYSYEYFNSVDDYQKPVDNT